jgi:hypothetical protein
MGKPFWAIKKVHPLTFQALIEVCFKASSFVVNLSTSIRLHLPSFILKYPCSLFLPFLVFTVVYVVGNNNKACHVLHCHILVLKLDIDIFTKVLEPLVEILTLEHKHPIVDMDDLNSPPPKHSRRNLDYE